VGRMGADVLRLVYASLDYTADITLGQTIFSAVSESYRKIRNTCRFLLGNLADFDPERDAIEFKDMLEFDRYILAAFFQLDEVVKQRYKEFDFQTAYRMLSQFMVVDLSATYIDVVRDRLYCSAENSRERRSAQTALFNILDALVRLLAPLIPFTAEEIYSYLPGKKELSVHLLTLKDRDEALKLLEKMRKEGEIGAPLDAHLDFGLASLSRGSWYQFLQRRLDDLKDLLIVSSAGWLHDDYVSKLPSDVRAGAGQEFRVDGKYIRACLVFPPSAEAAMGTLPADLLIIGRHASGVKCARCWKYFDDGS